MSRRNVKAYVNLPAVVHRRPRFFAEKWDGFHLYRCRQSDQPTFLLVDKGCDPKDAWPRDGCVLPNFRVEDSVVNRRSNAQLVVHREEEGRNVTCSLSIRVRFVMTGKDCVCRHLLQDFKRNRHFARPQIKRFVICQPSACALELRFNAACPPNFPIVNGRTRLPNDKFAPQYPVAPFVSWAGFPRALSANDRQFSIVRGIRQFT